MVPAAGPRVARSREAMFPKLKHPLVADVFEFGKHRLAHTPALRAGVLQLTSHGRHW